VLFTLSALKDNALLLDVNVLDDECVATDELEDLFVLIEEVDEVVSLILVVVTETVYVLDAFVEVT
jgi:hypothetical protein